MPELEVFWTKIGDVAIERGIMENGEAPLMLDMHAAAGTAGEIDLALSYNMGEPMLILTLKLRDRPSQLYAVQGRALIEAVLAAEGLNYEEDEPRPF